MASVEEIQYKILLGKAYYLELLINYTIQDQDGCKNCSPDKLRKIRMQIYELERSISDGMSQYDDVQELYSCFLKSISSYSGMSMDIDPNAIIPGTTIVVNVIGGERPYEKTFSWEDFIDNGEDGRIRYENSLWAGWNPILSVDNMPYLTVNVDYIFLDTGGFELLPDGNLPAIYETQIMRAVGYEPTGVTPPEEFINYPWVWPEL